MNFEQEVTDLIIRHGQTVNNRLARMQTWHERLDQKGVIQMRIVGQQLATSEFLPKTMLTGSQPRHLESAEIIQQTIKDRSGRFLEIVPHELFVERQYPEYYQRRKMWGSALQSLIVRKLKEEMELNALNPLWPLQDGETDYYLLRRAQAAVGFREDVFTNPRLQELDPLLIITSGGFTKAYLSALNNRQNPYLTYQAIKNWDLFNGSIVTLKGKKGQNWHSELGTHSHFDARPDLIG